MLPITFWGTKKMFLVMFSMQKDNAMAKDTTAIITKRNSIVDALVVFSFSMIAGCSECKTEKSLGKSCDRDIEFAVGISQEQAIEPIIEVWGKHLNDRLLHKALRGGVPAPYVIFYKQELESVTKLAQNSYAWLRTTNPELPELSKRQIAQRIAERAELQHISQHLKTQGISQVIEEFAGKVKAGSRMNSEKYTEFIQKFVSGEQSLETLLNKSALTTSEREGIWKFLERSGKIEAIEMGRRFGVVSEYDYQLPKEMVNRLNESGARVARVNLGRRWGNETWAADLVTPGKAEALVQHHMKNQLGAHGAREGSRPPVKANRNRVKELLYANQNTRRFRTDLYSHIRNTGISEDEQVKLATLVTNLGAQSLYSVNISSLVQTMAALLPLHGKVSNSMIAKTATLLRLYVADGQEITAAQYIAKTAKNDADIDAILERPIPGVEMARAWPQRPFRAFTEAGIRANNNLGLLCAEIRDRVKPQQQKAIVELLSKLYSSEKEVPNHYLEDLNNELGLIE